MKFKTEVKVGIIVLGTIVLVIWGINFLKGQNVLKRTDVYYAVYDDVAGLKMSGAVVLNGVKVGIINDIKFVGNRLDKIVVAFYVNTEYSLPRNSIAQIYNSDFLGTKVIRIIPSGEKEFHEIGDTLVSSIDQDMIAKLQEQISPLLETSEEAIKGLDTLITSINQVLDPATQKQLQSSLANLESTTASLSRQLSPGGKLDKTFASLQAFTLMLDTNKDKLGAAFANIESISDSVANANLTQTIANINSTFEQTQILLSKINSGEGSAGLLVSSDSLYNNLASATGHLSNLLEDMNKNPKRYVHFSLFGKKDSKE